MFNLERNGDAIFEAVSVAELKAHARIYTSADDDYIDILRIAAREQVEKDVQIAIVGQEYKLHLESWLDLRQLYYYRYGHMSDFYSRYDYYNQSGYANKIVLPIQPVKSVESITYTDPDGAELTLDPDTYTLKAFKDPPEIHFAN